MRLLAIDPSITSLGWAYHVDGEEDTGAVDGKKMRGMERIDMIRSEVLDLLDTVQPELIAYEGYAMNSKFGKVYDRAELGGLLKHEMWRRKIPILVVPPASLKLFMSGRNRQGKAGKEDVMREAARAYGRLFRTTDEADAYGLLLMGKATCDRRLLPRDRRHYKHRALGGCALLE